VAAVVFLIGAIAFGAWRLAGDGEPSALRAHIARISIEGVITGDKDTLKLIDDVADSHASAVILSIDSPGGTTAGSERLYDALRRLAAKKPVVAVVGTMAASGAYVAALGTDHIFAYGNSLVGSIGVLFQFPNVSGLLDKLGVKMEEVKSTPLKAAPNYFEPPSPEARAAIAALISDSYDWFKGLVKERRGMDDQQLAAVDDGRVFTGRQGLSLKLIDAIGGEREAIAWLESQKKIAPHLPVRDWRRSRSLERLGILGFSADVADWFGLKGLAESLRHVDIAAQSRLLDGLVAVWQGELVN
jgi:protease-4